MSSNSAPGRATYDIDLQTSDDLNVGQRPVLVYLGPAGTYSHQVYHTPKFTGCALKPFLLTGRTR